MDRLGAEGKDVSARLVADVVSGECPGWPLAEGARSQARCSQCMCSHLMSLQLRVWKRLLQSSLRKSTAM